jgi:hypothetical protein
MLEFRPMSDPLSIPDEKKTPAEINRHESTYRRSGRWLVALLLLWLAAMVGVAVLCPAYAVYICVFGILFVSIVALSLIRMVAYIRWTGKYPYYFLFRRSPRSDGKR